MNPPPFGRQSIRKCARDVDVVVHSRRPIFTSFEAMARACVDTHTHYTDITGETRVYEGLWAMDEAATGASIMLLPGTGSERRPLRACLAALLETAMPRCYAS